MVKKFLVIISCFLFFALVAKALAAEDPSTNSGYEFSTSYDVTYDVGIDGITQVSQKITLKNLTEQYYAANFSLTIGSTTITGILASDESGPMETKVGVKDGKTSINTKLNQQIVGQDKIQTLNLKFKSRDFAQNIGKTWEVNLPKIPPTGNIESYNLTLAVPISFGDPTSISPKPAGESQTYERLLFHFTKSQISNNGVSVNFGTTQIFDFILKYKLENKSLAPTITSITLPPDTNYQDVVINQLDPEPLNVTIDDDGNYLAWYQLAPRSLQQVIATGSAKLYIKPKNKYPNPLSSKQTLALTKSDKYWEKDNTTISTMLSEIFKNRTPQSNKEKARLIYQYIVTTLVYDTTRISSRNFQRLGAVTALVNPSSVLCSEFTDLFIALSRAASIPTRELDGYAYSQNKILRPLSLSKDLLHAWPEYFDQNLGWVMVDPTWENTSGGVDYFNKFDLNHLVLAIKGASSQTPNTTNNTQVEISQKEFSGQPQIGVGLEIADILWAGLPASIIVRVENRGNMVQQPLDLSLNTNQITVAGLKSVRLGMIPAKGFSTYQFNLRTPFTWQTLEDNLEIEIAKQKFTKKIIIKPIFLFYPIPYIFAGVTVLAVLIYLAILGAHFYKKGKLTIK